MVLTSILVAGVLFTQAPAAPQTPPADAVPAATAAQERPTPPLSELHVSKMDGLYLAIQLLDAQVAIRKRELQDAIDALRADVAKAHPGYHLDFQQRALTPDSEAQKPGADKDPEP